MHADAEIDVTRDALAQGLAVRLTVRGESMTPALYSGSEVEIVPVNGALYRGQVVALAVGPRLVVHRIHRLTPFGVVTRGDARTTADAPLPRGDVLGLVQLPGGQPLPRASRRQRLIRRARGLVAYFR
jgi:hypothetical protein